MRASAVEAIGESASLRPYGERPACQFPGIVEAAEHFVDDGFTQLADHDHVPLAQVQTNLGALDEIPHGSEYLRGDEEEPPLLPLELDCDLDAPCKAKSRGIESSTVYWITFLASMSWPPGA